MCLRNTFINQTPSSTGICWRALYTQFELYNLQEEQASNICSLFPGLKGLLATPSPGLALAAQRYADLGRGEKEVWDTCYEDK